MSFFEELKRRNVVRVGIAYVLLGWVVMQGADFLLDLVGAPEWVIRVFAIAGLVGLPFALFFAWAFELTPEGIKRESEVDRTRSITPQTGRKLDRTIIVFLVLAVIGLLVDKFTPENVTPPPVPQAESAPAAAQQPAEPETGEQSIAVLPFVDMSPDGDQAYFADGIAEEILNVLVKTHSLKVAGRTSSFQFGGRNEDLRLIGKELGVEHILEGSIRKDQNRVRITAQLVKADDGFHLWSETYDRELTDIFAIQDEIARAITEALAVELDLGRTGPRLATEQTRNMEAYDHYLEARALIARRENFKKAIELLDGAIEHDPDFAQAWAANAQAHSLAVYYVKELPVEDYLADAERMANHALEIDPLLSQAHSVLGDVYRDREEWLRSQASYQRALALNPDDVEANEQYAQMLARVGLRGEALEYSNKAAKLDPLSAVNLTHHGLMLDINGQRGEAWTQIEKALTINPANPYIHFAAYRLALEDGDFDRAIELFTPAVTPQSDPSGRLQQLLDVLPSREAALEVLRSQAESDTHWADDLILMEQANWALYFGDLELAGALLGKSATGSDDGAVYVYEWLWVPLMQPMLGSEVFKDIIRRGGLDRFWAATRYPDFCRPVGEDDFDCSMSPGGE